MLPTPLLDSLQLPEDIAGLSFSQLQQLAKEIRSFLIESVNKTGGHLSSSLGVVELSIALHAIFKSPDDKIIWDVGHQCYAHKILTGRKDKMATLRQLGGISGFTKRSESVHDAFGAGHSSTSISAAMGMAYAMQGKNDHAIAVIGDGALTGGMAFEALNHAGTSNANILVILNDNNMSISENVGAMSRYLGKVLSSRPYSALRESSRKVLLKVPKLWDFAQRAEVHMKGMVVPGTLFEEMGFHYIGPIDGHDINVLVRALKIMKDLSGPQFLHIITKKGKGFAKAEQDPINYHGLAPKSSKSSGVQSYTSVFGEWICQVAKKDKKIIAITPAMREGSGLVKFHKMFPKRFIDVGIAEQHAITLAAGLACEGMKPIVAIYSSFLQRGYDQLIHDVALQNLPVIFAIDRAGVVGADGATHAGVFDLSFLNCVPNLTILAPAYQQEFISMLDFCLSLKTPVAIRYPRADCLARQYGNDEIKLGKSQIILQGQNIAVLAFGSIVTEIEQVAEKYQLTLVNMRFVKPLDVDMIDKLAANHKTIITIETNVVTGGAGSAVLQHVGNSVKVINLGLPDVFVEQGTIAEIYQKAGLDAAGFEQTIISLLEQ